MGVNGRTDEYIIGTETGTTMTRTIKRRPDQDKWKPELIVKINYYPWDPKPRTEDKKPPIKLDDRIPPEEMPTTFTPPVPQARRVYISRDDINTRIHTRMPRMQSNTRQARKTSRTQQPLPRQNHNKTARDRTRKTANRPS